MRIFERDEIAAAVGIGDLLEPVKAALVAYSRGATQATPIGLLDLPDRAEVHVKAGYVPGLDVFAVKVATMYPALRRSDGALLVCRCDTGEPVALLRDRKLLTDLRTAAVGALATDALARRDARTVAVFGTGGQARLQALAACLVRPIERVLVWGRDRARAEALARELPHGELAPDGEAAAREADILITATASREPLLHPGWLRPGRHVTAVGADDAHKRELAAGCYARADRVVVDSLALNARYGDLPDALAAGLPEPAELGAVLSGAAPGRRSDGELTIAKHVGIGIEDAAAAAAALTRLGTASAAPPPRGG